jgi:hypothetical protein
VDLSLRCLCHGDVLIAQTIEHVTNRISNTFDEIDPLKISELGKLFRNDLLILDAF